MADDVLHFHAQYLELDRCPRCSIARPSLKQVYEFVTSEHTGKIQRRWGIYVCGSCGGVALAWSIQPPDKAALSIMEILPEPQGVHPAIPERAGEYLKQAIESLHTPSGAIMLAASAIDAMLDAKEFPKSIGSLYARINKAVESHAITEEMGAWAHQVRLDANDERHPDHDTPLPDQEDARKTVEFARALGEFMFVLPARVSSGIAASSPVSSGGEG